MSLDRIRRLLADANTQPGDAAALRALAAQVAEDTHPAVQHPNLGYGVVVGVLPDGLLEVTFGGSDWAVAIPADAVREAEWLA